MCWLNFTIIFTQEKSLKNKWIYIRKGFSRERGFGHGRWLLLAGGPGPVKISWQRSWWRGSVIKVKTTSKTNHNNNNNYGNNNNNSGCATTTESEFSSRIAHTTCVLRNRKVGLLLENGPPKQTGTYIYIHIDSHMRTHTLTGTHTPWEQLLFLLRSSIIWFWSRSAVGPD